jgi:hypothetical protein
MISSGYHSPTLLSLSNQKSIFLSFILHCEINSNQNLPILVGMISHLHIMLLHWPCALASKTYKILSINLGSIWHNKDGKRILKGRPWVFEGSLFIIEDFDGQSSLSNFTFDKAAFWVRMLDTPLACTG